MIENTLLATLCGLIAATSWGIADFFGAKASKSTNPVFAALFVQVIGSVLFTIIYFVFLTRGLDITLSGFAYGAAAGVFMTLGLSTFYKGLEIGPVSIVSPIGAAYPLVTAIITLMVFGISLTPLQLAGIVLIVAGVMAAAGLMDARKSEKKFTSGVVMAVGTFIFWGIAFALLEQAIIRLGWETATLLQVIFTVVGFAVLFPILRGKERLTLKQFQIIKNKWVVAASITQLLGVVVFNLGLTMAASGAIITAISACYPALTVFLALKHFDEKISLIPLAGAFTTIVGVVLLSIK